MKYLILGQHMKTPVSLQKCKSGPNFLNTLNLFSDLVQECVLSVYEYYSAIKESAISKYLNDYIDSMHGY